MTLKARRRVAPGTYESESDTDADDYTRNRNDRLTTVNTTTPSQLRHRHSHTSRHRSSDTGGNTRGGTRRQRIQVHLQPRRGLAQVGRILAVTSVRALPKRFRNLQVGALVDCSRSLRRRRSPARARTRYERRASTDGPTKEGRASRADATP